ncbi:MAG: TIGR04454 family lipoprotein [Spirochaetota bacterium]
MKHSFYLFLLVLLLVFSCKKKEKSETSTASSNSVEKAKEQPVDKNSLENCQRAVKKILTKLESEIPAEQKQQFSQIEAKIVSGLQEECKLGKWNTDCLKDANDLQSMTVCKR